MKTWNEVEKHLAKVGYTTKSVDRIISFLIGADILDAQDYEIEYIEGKHDFLDFIEWFKSAEEYEMNDNDFEHEIDKEMEAELKELAKLTKELEESLGNYEDGNPFKKLAQAVVEMSNEVAKQVSSKNEKTCEECYDCLEVKAHEALDNIFASLHEGKLDKDEQEVLVDSMNALVQLGNEYE